MVTHLIFGSEPIVRSILTIAVIGGLTVLSGAALACAKHDAAASIIAPETTADATKTPVTKIPTGTATKTTKPSG